MAVGRERGGEVAALLLCPFLCLFPSPPLTKFLFHPHLLHTTFPPLLPRQAPPPPPLPYHSHDPILLPTPRLHTHHRRVLNTEPGKEMRMMTLTRMSSQRSQAFFWVGEKVVRTCLLGPCPAAHLHPYHHANHARRRHR